MNPKGGMSYQKWRPTLTLYLQWVPRRAQKVSPFRSADSGGSCKGASNVKRNWVEQDSLLYQVILHYASLLHRKVSRASTWGTPNNYEKEAVTQLMIFEGHVNATYTLLISFIGWVIYLEWIIDLKYIILPCRYVRSLKSIVPLQYVNITQSE